MHVTMWPCKCSEPACLSLRLARTEVGYGKVTSDNNAALP